MSPAVALSAHTFWHWWPSFFTSPGLAGLAAVVAAVIAWRSVSRQVTQAERKRGDERKVALDQRWWETFTWVYDRTFAVPEGDRLNPDVSLAMLKALQDEATSEGGTTLQQRTVAAISASFRPSTQPDEPALPEHDRPRRETASDRAIPVDDATSQIHDWLTDFANEPALIRVSDSSQDLLRSLWEDGQSISPAAGAALYENAVKEALMEVWTSSTDRRIYRPVAVDGSLVDFVVEAEHGLVGIEVKARPTVTALRNGISQLRRAISTSSLAGGVIVCPLPLEERVAESLGQALGDKIRFLQWDPSDDPAVLRDAITRAAGDPR